MMFNFGIYDRRHSAAIRRRLKAVIDLFDTAAINGARIGEMSGFNDPDKPFDLSDYPATKKRIDELVASLYRGLESVVSEGDKDEWLLSCEKNDAMIDWLASSTNIPREQILGWKQPNLDALSAFQQRKTDGMGLSDRVWNITDQFRSELEMALDIGLGEGKSAAALSQAVRRYLKDPDKLFRRVRDKHGNLRLSKAAKNYHPGRGVYRSAYKNALRLTATENNIAYRTADHTRWQQVDSVVGIEIKLSNNHTSLGRDGKPHPFFDICDELAGHYPKTFKFTGWHPFCRCFAVPILKTMDEMEADLERIMDGLPPATDSVNAVNDVPDVFKKWVSDNADRIRTAKKQPYFIRDNRTAVNDILKTQTGAKPRTLTPLEKAKLRHDARTPEQISNIRKRWEERKKNPLLDDMILTLKQSSIERLEVTQLQTKLSTDEIISRVAGGDMTKGSCSSLALAFAGNRLGFDVLDYRDGASRKFFANAGNIRKLTEIVGGVVERDYNDFNIATKLLSKVQEGKEYYFSVGKHAAIVRRMGGQLQYLELQSDYQQHNIFANLTVERLKKRFGCQKSHTFGGTKFPMHGELIDIEVLKGQSTSIRELLAFINTEASKQKKGIRGSMK